MKEWDKIIKSNKGKNIKLNKERIEEVRDSINLDAKEYAFDESIQN
jgi:hypothetical protein